MDINEGIQIDEPGVFVPWGIGEEKLVALFNGENLEHITDGYYAIKCTLFNSLTCMLGFHFEPNLNGNLSELEFFRSSYDDQKGSFNEFQKYFVQQFGKPTNTNQGSKEGFNDYEWVIDDIKIIHLIYNRFGPEEHMRVRNMLYSDY
jgi:hypothetical protein